MKPEIRSFSLEGLTSSPEGKLSGHAAVFNSLSRRMGGFREKIAETAFDKAIAEEQDVRALWNHDANFVLGRTKSKTLTISKDARGLLVEITPPDSQWARDCIASVVRGDVDQMSFQFRTIKDHWEEVGDEIIRTLIEVDLYDVSPVTFPAYEDTDLQLRSLDGVPEEFRAKLEQNALPQGDQKVGAGEDSTPAKKEWIDSQERNQLLALRVSLAEKS